MDAEKYNICAVIPAYRVEKQIDAVLRSIPRSVQHIIVVDDASPDATHEVVAAAARRDARIVLVRHSTNQGVGGAMVSGFKKAIELGPEIVVKIDGDGQMDLAHLDALLEPLVQGKADYAKGNRFRDFASLRRMPFVRRIGNLALGFLAKAATGYWHMFDPTNGFVAMRLEALRQLPLERIDRSYFFETSMLANLYMVGAVVRDVPMPARYQGEGSSLVIGRVLADFPPKLLLTFFRRLGLRNFIYDFSMSSVYLLAGLPLLLFGLIFGAIKWYEYATRGIPAPTGTVMLPTLCVLVGIQFLISAVEIDLRSSPSEPLSAPLP